MIKERTEIKTLTQKFTIFEGKFCDICGKRSPNEDNWLEDDRYHGDFIETTIEIRSGYHYGNDSDSQLLEYDVCPECFNKHIQTLMKNPPTKRNISL